MSFVLFFTNSCCSTAFFLLLITKKQKPSCLLNLGMLIRTDKSVVKIEKKLDVKFGIICCTLPLKDDAIIIIIIRCLHY